MIKILDETTVNEIAQEGPFSITEIAEIVGASQSEVYLALRRALRKLARDSRFRQALLDGLIDKPGPYEIKTVTKIRITAR